MIKEAYARWLLADVKAVELAKFIESGDMFALFEAGWNAARAEPRSDAADAADALEIPAHLRAHPSDKAA